MTDIPVIMSAPMIEACLREIRAPGTGKTMTRRSLYTKRRERNGRVPSATLLQDHPPPRGKLSAEGWPADIGPDEYWTLSGWHKVKAGDRLWVRENLVRQGQNWLYAADVTYLTLLASDPRVSAMIAWAHHQERDNVNSIHMPRWASRLTLIVGDVKVERLQDISEEDAKAEGVERCIAGQDERGLLTTYRTGFVRIWSILHGLESWTGNPWVVAIAFIPVLSNIDAVEAQAA